MSIDQINFHFEGVKGIKDIAPKGGAAPVSSTPDSFGDYLSGALKEVDGMQREAENQTTGLVLKSPDVTPHSAMVALEKADVAFQLMSAVRSKIIRAYEDVMRTQV